MDDNLKKTADAFFATDEGKKLASKRGELEKLADSKDGEHVKKMLGGEDIRKAAETGDVAKLSAVVKSVLATEEGARIAKKLSEMLK